MEQKPDFKGVITLGYLDIRQVIADYYKTDIDNVIIKDDIICDDWGRHTGLTIEIRNQEPKMEADK